MAAGTSRQVPFVIERGGILNAFMLTFTLQMDAGARSWFTYDLGEFYIGRRALLFCRPGGRPGG
jgi:hypothetical protein